MATRPGRVAFALVIPDRAGNESIRTFDFRGERVKDLPSPQGRISAMCLGDDGSRLWAGTEKGILAEFDLEKGDQRPQRNFEGAVTHLTATPLALVVAAGVSIHLLPWNRDARELKLGMERPIARVAVSADGRRVAACDPTLGGTLRAWEIDLDGALASDLELDPKSRGRTLSLAFSPGGDRLVSGDGDGGIRTWELPERPGATGDPGQSRACQAPGCLARRENATPGDRGWNRLDLGFRRWPRHAAGPRRLHASRWVLARRRPGVD